MDEHRDELPQNITQLSQQLQRLEALFGIKQVMVHEECTKSTSEITQCFKRYQNDLLETFQTVTLGIEKSKQDAKTYLSKIELQLQTIEKDILNLADAPVYQPDRMEALLNQLNELEEQLETYETIKDSQLEIPLPKFTLKFQSVPRAITDTPEIIEPQSSDSGNTTGRRENRRHSFHPYSRVSNKARKKE